MPAVLVPSQALSLQWPPRIHSIAAPLARVKCTREPTRVCSLAETALGAKEGTARSVCVRPAQHSDLKALYRIELASEGFWSYKQLQDELSNQVAVFLTAVEASERQGFVIAWHVADEVQILELAVAPSARRKGIGSLLMTEVITECQKSGKRARLACLEVAVSNAAAISLYERLGFCMMGRRREYYPNGEDALLMQCVLQPHKEADARMQQQQQLVPGDGLQLEVLEGSCSEAGAST